MGAFVSFRHAEALPVTTRPNRSVRRPVIGDWFATALFWRPQVALVVNARTFRPVFTPLAPAPKLLDRLPDEIASVLDLHGVDRAVTS